MFEVYWDKTRKRISHVQRIVRRETKTWVIVGSCFVMIFALLFILVRLWALHGIRVSEAQVEARNVLTHELGVPAFIVDRDSKIIDINHAAEAHFDVAKGGATGRYLTDFITYDEVDTADNHSLPTSRRAVFIHPRTTKKSIFVAHTIRLREIDGSEKFTIVCHDTTTNYELEIQKKVLSRKSRACSQFMSHRRVLPRGPQQVHSGSHDARDDLDARSASRRRHQARALDDPGRAQNVACVTSRGRHAHHDAHELVQTLLWQLRFEFEHPNRRGR